jgi:hypothetical protein
VAFCGFSGILNQPPTTNNQFSNLDSWFLPLPQKYKFKWGLEPVPDAKGAEAPYKVHAKPSDAFAG